MPQRFKRRSSAKLRYGLDFLATILFLLGFTATSLSYPSGEQQDEAKRSHFQDAALLESGKGITRTIASGQTHYYRVEVGPDQYVSINFYQDGIDLIVTLIAPDGTELSQPDTARSTELSKLITWDSETGGSYLLEVRPREQDAAGKYGVYIARLLERTERNKSLIAADRLTADGWRLHEIGTEEALRESVERLTQAIPHWRAVGDEYAGETGNLIILGEVYYNLGEYQKALDVYDQALSLARQYVDQKGDAWAYNNIGKTYEMLGEKQKAIDYYIRSLRLAEHLASREKRKYYRPIAIAMTNLGGLYASLGEAGTAVNYLSRAIPHWRWGGQPDSNGEARALYYLGDVYRQTGDYRKAIQKYEQALRFWRNTADLLRQARALNGISRSHILSGEYRKALDYLSEALRVELLAGNRRDQASTLLYTGQAYYALGEIQKAMEHYNQALELCQATSNLETEASTLYNIARAHRDGGLITEARDAMEQSLRKIELVRMSFAGAEMRASYLATVRDYYEFYIDLLMRLHRLNPKKGFDGEALQASERARARALVETLAESGADIRQGVDPDLVERERSLQRRLNAREAYRMTQPARDRAARDAVEKEIEDILAEYEQVRAQIRATSPRYSALTQPAPITLGEIQQLLDEETLLLEYALGDEVSYLWAITPASITSFELPKRVGVESHAKTVYELLTARNKHVKGETFARRQARLQQAEREYPSSASRLSEMVLGPVSSMIAGKRLVIVADGALQYVPFAALPMPEAGGRGDTETRRDSPAPRIPVSPSLRVAATPLIAEHEIVSLPSAATLQVLRQNQGRKQASGTVIAVADPVFERSDPRVKARKSTRVASRPESELVRSANESGAGNWSRGIPRLSQTRQEAESIVSLAPEGGRRLAVDFDASLTTALSGELNKYRYVHIATHGLLNGAHPELSGVVLSLVDAQGNKQDGFLRLNQVYNLRLAAEMVVLSACQTGLGKEVRGEGLIGLTRGFMYAGAPRVAASLWKIEDRATSELMGLFYKGMLGEKKLTPAAALREAQVEMWKKGGGQHPYYWAAFVLQGEWR